MLVTEPVPDHRDWRYAGFPIPLLIDQEKKNPYAQLSLDDLTDQKTVELATMVLQLHGPVRFMTRFARYLYNGDLRWTLQDVRLDGTYMRSKEYVVTDETLLLFLDGYLRAAPLTGEPQAFRDFDWTSSIPVMPLADRLTEWLGEVETLTLYTNYPH